MQSLMITDTEKFRYFLCVQSSITNDWKTSSL